MSLLLAAHFVDDAFEDAARGRGVERRLGGPRERFQHASLALRVVDLGLVPALELTDLQDQLDPLLQ